MRTPVKFRIAFFAIAISIFALAFNLLPDVIESKADQYVTLIFACGFFLLIPLLYWMWIVRIGKQKPWKIILIISLSFVVARYSFPAEIADHFEFVMWLRYPIMAVLLAIELYMIFHVVRSLWNARHLSGDPRVHVIENYKKEDEKKLLLGVLMSYEPASWFYTIPYFSRNHPKALGQLSLLSANAWHWLGLLFATLLVTTITYLLLFELSELVAIIVSSLIGYSVIIITANYRLSKHFSIYCLDEKLVINNNILGILVVPMDSIECIESGEWNKTQLKEKLVFGWGKHANVKIQFNSEQQYIGGMGQFVESFNEVYLVIKNPNPLLHWGQQHIANSAPQ